MKLTLEFSLDSAAFQDGDAGAVEIMRVLDGASYDIEHLYAGRPVTLRVFDSSGDDIGALIVSN